MTTVYATAFAGNTTNKNDTTPGLRSHTRQAAFGNDKLAPSVDLHHLVPVIFANVFNVSDSSAQSGIGDEDGDGFVCGNYCGLL
jgi:hypothetical protein